MEMEILDRNLDPKQGCEVCLGALFVRGSVGLSRVGVDRGCRSPKKVGQLSISSVGVIGGGLEISNTKYIKQDS